MLMRLILWYHGGPENHPSHETPQLLKIETSCETPLVTWGSPILGNPLKISVLISVLFYLLDWLLLYLLDWWITI